MLLSDQELQLIREQSAAYFGAGTLGLEIVEKLLGHADAVKSEYESTVEAADNLIDEKDRQFRLLEADTASLIRAGNEMQKNLGIWTGPIESALYRWDEVVKQTTAIGAVQLLRDAEEARKLRTRVGDLRADLSYGVFPGGRSYEEWVAAGRPYEADKANG